MRKLSLALITLFSIVFCSSVVAEAEEEDFSQGYKYDNNFVYFPETLAGRLSGTWAGEVQNQFTLPDTVTALLNLAEGRLFVEFATPDYRYRQEVSIIDKLSDSQAYWNGVEKPYKLVLAKKGEKSPYLTVQCTDAQCEGITISEENKAKGPVFKRVGGFAVRDLIRAGHNTAGYKIMEDVPGMMSVNAIESTDTLEGTCTGTWLSSKNKDLQVDINFEAKPFFVRLLTPTSSRTYIVNKGKNDSAKYGAANKHLKLELLSISTNKPVGLITLNTKEDPDDESIDLNIGGQKYNLKRTDGLYVYQLIPSSAQ